MPTILIDGFNFSKWAGGKLLLQVGSDRLNESIEYCNKHQIKLLHISRYHGYGLNDVDFLSKCPNIEEIHMQGGFSNYDGLYQLPNLKSLSAIFEHSINVAAIASLQNLSTDWNPDIDEFIFSAKNLQVLWLRNYKPKTRDLGCMGNLTKLTELRIILSLIDSTRGIETLSGLKKLELSYCSKLVDIQSLLKCRKTLEELVIDHCKKIQDLTIVKNFFKLNKIILAETGSVPSLKFIRQMSELKFLSFVGTNILDGDMTPCFGLEYAGFLNKRGYSHTIELRVIE